MEKTKWILDTVHSEIEFKVKHLMISTVTGRFQKFEGTAETEGDDFNNARIQFSAEIASLTTNSDDRDKHLKSGDFFDAEQFPTLDFKSTSFVKEDDENFNVTGNLTMHGITKEVQLEAEFGGAAADAYGNSRAGFEVRGKVDRKDFNMNFSMATETGGIVVGNEVKIIANVQFIKQA